MIILAVYFFHVIHYFFFCEAFIITVLQQELNIV